MTSLLRRRRARRYPGLYRGTVVGATDPQGAQRLLVSVPSLTGAAQSWAPTLREIGPRPQVGDVVLVGFEAGRTDRPVVVGVLATAPTPVELADENGNSIRLGPTGVEITAAAGFRLQASTVSAVSGTVRVDAAMSDFSGVVKTPTLIADSVVASSYTPGAGNIS